VGHDTQFDDEPRALASCQGLCSMRLRAVHLGPAH
jgi:hypothetical protein